MEMFLSGNQCIAHGVKLSRVEVISAYPITPATPASEELYEMVERGELDADIVMPNLSWAPWASAWGQRRRDAGHSTALALKGSR